MPVSILQCTGQPPSPITKNDPAPNVPGGEIEKPSFTMMPRSVSAVLFESWHMPSCSLLNFITQPSAWHTVGLQ